MKQLVVLVLLVLMLVPVTSVYTSEESYYLYPAISYVGDSTDLPAGEMIEWTADCTIFFKGVKVQEMIPTVGIILDADKYTIQSFTLSEMFDIYITYTVRAFIRSSTEYLWNGVLHVDEQTTEEIARDEASWVQYKCFDVSGDWSIGLYASTSGNTQTRYDGILLLLFFGVAAIITKKVWHWKVNRRKENEF